MAANRARQDGNRATATTGADNTNPPRAQRAPRTLFSMAFPARETSGGAGAGVDEPDAVAAADSDVDTDTDEPLLVIDLRDDEAVLDLTRRTIANRDEAAAEDLRLRRALLAQRAADLRRLLNAERGGGSDTLTVPAEPAIAVDQVLPADAGLVAKVCTLDQLRRDGLISEVDYQAKVAELLGR